MSHDSVISHDHCIPLYVADFLIDGSEYCTLGPGLYLFDLTEITGLLREHVNDWIQRPFQDMITIQITENPCAMEFSDWLLSRLGSTSPRVTSNGHAPLRHFACGV